MMSLSIIIHLQIEYVDIEEKINARNNNEHKRFKVHEKMHLIN
jgi:hypothetical protein